MKGNTVLKTPVRILIGLGFCILLTITWVIAINSKSTAEKQLVLINTASELIDDGIYIRAVPLLEEAAGYIAAHTLTAENKLKTVYLALMDTRGFSRKYTTLLDKQMERHDAQPEVFMEAAVYYLSIAKLHEALNVLKSGIEKTRDVSLVTLYENSRYAYETNRVSYDEVTAIYGQTIQVRQEGNWGIAHADGSILIPCEYEKVSTFYEGRAVVMSEGAVFAVDRDNNRIAVPYEKIAGFKNLADGRIPLLVEGSWRRATGDFELGSYMFEDIGMYSGGYAAAKTNGSWGVIDLSTNWLIPPEYDEIIQDELGRCYAQGAVFVRTGDRVYLIVNGNRIEDVYEDARPFTSEGYAAVKKNGKWGFIDKAGNVVIPFNFDDALSFGQHLAAVKQGDYWGYISIYGHVVIDTIYYEAKSFSGGSAPVLTERGWQFITLLEYKKGASL